MGKKSFTPSVGKKYRNTTLKIKLKLKNNNNNNIKKTHSWCLGGTNLSEKQRKHYSQHKREKRKRNLQQNKEKHRERTRGENKTTG